MKFLSLRVDLRVALLYTTFGGLWILFSDRLLASLVRDVATLSLLQTYKGWGFVIVSALLIFSLLRRELNLRKRAEGDFQESEERYRLLFENSLDAIVLGTPEGRIFAANPAACRMFQRTQPELMELGRRGLSDVTTPRIKAAWEQRLRTGSFHGELAFNRKDGTTFPAEVTTTLFENKEGHARTSLIIRDITARRQAEQALRESEKRYRLISENSADVIWTLNPATERFTYVSPSMFNLRGLTPEEVIAEPLQTGLTPASYQWITEYLPDRIAAFEAGDSSARTAIAEVEQIQKDGSFVPTEVVTTLIADADGEVIEILGITRDITERKQAEAQIQRQIQHLSSLHLVDIAISSSFDLHVVFDIVLQQLTSQLGVDAAVILLLNPERQVLEYAASRGLDATGLQHVNFRLGNEQASRVMRARKIIRNRSFQQREDEPASALKLANEIFADYFGVPLLVKGEVKGVLEIYHRSALQAGPEWMQFLETIAGQAAIATDNAQLFKSLQRVNNSLEQRVVERTAELHQANIELERANRAKDEFLATISQELRTPLNNILKLSESLLEEEHGSLNDQQQKHLHTILSCGHHLFELLNDILVSGTSQIDKSDVPE
jgi:PAS domain S-box-containing protein